ncbi:MAG: hypothetical protein H6828_13050 [Planctomycetes bacterium]|nr:hypothetical protein [Planctomycetota bacterium]
MRRLPALLVLLAVPAAAQTGSNDCASPDLLLGQGAFAFDSSAASAGAQGQSESPCYLLGSSAVDHDVWFTWVADTTGTATLSTCASLVDTKIAAYPGSACPSAGSALACNDDACGLQSLLAFPVTANTSYALQIGTFPGAPGGAGTLELVITPAAQGDDCAAPVTIVGQGGFLFDNAGASTGLEGQGEALCYVFGSSAVQRDVWFRWVPSASGTAVARTCGATVDTKLAAYPGALCPTNGSALACNDDACGFQSSVSFPATAGVPCMLQVGTYPGAPGGAGVLQLEVWPPLAADECATPAPLAGQGAFPFDTTVATAGAEGQSEATCLAFGTSAFDHDVWFAWTADATGTARLSTCGSGLDTKLAVYPGGGCPAAGTALACDDDALACGGVQAEVELAVSAGASYLVQLGSFPGAAGGAGTLTVTLAAPSEPGSAYCGCDGGAAPCSNPGGPLRGCANGSAPLGARVWGSGAAVVGADTLVLSAEGLPPGQPGLWFQGQNAVGGGLGAPFGDGLRCAGGDVRRLGVVAADAAGTSSTAALSAPVSVLGGLASGDLRRYQLWYRDPAGSPCGQHFNLSNGYAVQW